MTGEEEMDLLNYGANNVPKEHSGSKYWACFGTLNDECMRGRRERKKRNKGATF